MSDMFRSFEPLGFDSDTLGRAPLYERLYRNKADHFVCRRVNEESRDGGREKKRIDEVVACAREWTTFIIIER